MSLAPDDPRHGTDNGYRNHGCRCDDCRSASSEYHRARGSAGYRRDVCACGQLKYAKSSRCMACERARVEAPHGTESRYTSGRCRCELCRAAASAARRRRQRRAGAAA